MDKYAILCIFTLIVLCLWHATIGAFIFLYIPEFRVTPDMWLAYIDQCVFMTAISLFILIHTALLIWLYFVPLKYRREMSKKDLAYRRRISKEKKPLDYTPILM